MTQPISILSERHLGELEQLARTTPAGHAIVEVGVFRGGSAWYLAKVAEERGDPLHLFDTFTGIPFADPDDGNGVGQFDAREIGGADAVQRAIPYAKLHIGVFPETMPKVFPTVSFVHSDCDQYRSVRAVIDRFWPILTPGGVMAFDDMDTTGGQRAILESFPNISQEHNWWMVRKPHDL